MALAAPAATLTVTGVPIERRAAEDGEGLGPLIDRAGRAGDGGVERDVLRRPALNVAEALAAAVAAAAALITRSWLLSVKPRKLVVPL